MMIPDDKIAEIRESVDLVALINEYVPLRRHGSRFVGLCPFHNEKTPSFGVSRGKQFFYCFGCHASGDAIGFLIQHQGHSFVEAVEQLAERAGIELPRLEGPEQVAHQKARSRRDKFAAVMEAATLFYEAQLAQSPEAALARDELTKRGVSHATTQTFRLGYAPGDWDSLATHLAAERVPLEDAAELGLIAPRRSGGGYYDRFRHRLMFPVADTHGRVVAFSGRALPQETPEGQPPPAKYINSPEGPLYTKGSVLFGLHQARVPARKHGHVLLCEGNFDLLAIHQAGFEHVLAPLGTAFTSQQAKLIRRYAENMTVVFDGDRAGLAAAEKAIELGQQAGIAVRIVTLPEGEDPDSFVRSRGVESFESLVSSAPTAIEFTIERAAAAASDPASIAHGIRSLGPVLLGIESPVERDLYVERVGRRFGLRDMKVVRAELRRGVLDARRAAAPTSTQMPPHRDPRGNAEGRDPVQGDGSRVGARMREPSSFRGLEPQVLGAMLEHPQLFETTEALRFEELLTDPDLRAIFRITANIVSSGGEVRAVELLQRLADHPARAWLGQRLSDEIRTSFEYANAALRDCIPRLADQRVQQQRLELQQRILRARQEGDHELAAALARQRDELARTQQRGGQTR